MANRTVVPYPARTPAAHFLWHRDIRLRMDSQQCYALWVYIARCVFRILDHWHGHGVVAASLYIVDAHRMSKDFLPRICILIEYRGNGHRGLHLHAGLQDCSSFVLTFYAYTWFAHGGIKHTMVIIGSIQVGICLLSIPMCELII